MIPRTAISDPKGKIAYHWATVKAVRAKLKTCAPRPQPRCYDGGKITGKVESPSGEPARNSSPPPFTEMTASS